MPTYSYSRGDEVVERVFPMGEAPQKIRVGRKVFERDVAADHRQFKNTPGNWPMYCDASGVNPDQIPEAIAHAKSLGVSCDFTKDGRAIFTSPGHRKRYLEAHGFFDRNGGYGDPQRA